MPRITVEHDLTAGAYETCRKWASVSRTITEASRLLQERADELEDGGQDELISCAQELDDLRYLLDTLHSQTRSAIWAIER